MAGTASTGKAALAVEEARLARAAAAGDGSAFATLYERYARRAYNLAYRLTGSEEDAGDAVQDAFLNVMRRLPQLGDRELAFGSYLFTATRNASYDLMSKQRRAQPSDSIPESAVPVGASAGGLGLDPGDPDEDPDRKQLLASQQDEVREANGRLPERQREALALRELEDLSYDEIAEVMGMNRNSVAQLISRARINLRDELRGTALASVAASSPDCERALPLIAMRDDGQLDDESDDAAWLEDHLSGCDRCRVATGAMQEAGASYRAWVPIAVGPWLFKATMARAAELSGADWSEVIAERSARQADVGSLPGMPPAYLTARENGRRKSRRRRAAIVASLAALLLVGGIAGVFASGDDGPAPASSQPASAGHPARNGAASRHGARSHAKHRRKRSAASEPASGRQQKATTTGGATTGAPAPAPQGQAGSQGGGSPESASHPSGGSGTAGLNPTKAPSKHPPASAPAPEPAPEPAPAPAPTPAPEEPPATTEPPPSEEPPEEPPPEEPSPPAGVPPGAGVP